MKNTLILMLIFNTIIVCSQIPNGYYDGTDGLEKEKLKTKLSEIITNGHRDMGYSGLWKAYKTTDIDIYYEKDGTILDIYSENPKGVDPYNFIIDKSKCGNYNMEGDCYNREHIVPQSLFYKKAPMVSDIHFIRATDGKVNGIRSNYPFGNVKISEYISKNGSKLGKSSSYGYNGIVFEPIDEFKGDIARMIFYFVTRYENKIPSFKTGNMFNGTTYPSIEQWELDVLLNWNEQDPVSQVEIDRNNESYKYQGNRNPYIDNPSFVDLVWGKSRVTIPKPSPSTYCGTEDFENIGISSAHYLERGWTNKGVTWMATDARTDKTINGRALTIRNGNLKSSKLKNGLKNITITTKLEYKGTAGFLTLLVNGKNVGKLPYDKNIKTTTIDNIDIEGDVIISIENNSKTNRVSIDDLQWTCYNSLDTKEIIDDKREIKISPNPIKNNQFKIYGIKGSKKLKIYDMSGKLLKEIKNVKDNQMISLQKFHKGIYIIQIENFRTKILIP